MSVMELKLYDLLKAKLGQNEAESIVEFIRVQTKEEAEDYSKNLATKEFVKDEINRVELKIEQTKTDIIKWMFAFWIGQIAVIAGILMYFLKR